MRFNLGCCGEYLNVCTQEGRSVWKVERIVNCVVRSSVMSAAYQILLFYYVKEMKWAWYMTDMREMRTA
jgi:hypothetical protein